MNPRQKLHKAVFLDRDGTAIRQVELLHKTRDIRLLPGAGRAVRELNRLHYRIVLVTNQPVVARGIATEEMMDGVHTELRKRLLKQGAVLDAIYACPHHPNANVLKYRVSCDCRKPEIGMLTKAAKELHLDLSKSVMIGDSTRDTLAGNRAGLLTILVKTGHGGKDPWQFEGKPDVVVKNLLEAVRYIRTHGYRH